MTEIATLENDVDGIIITDYGHTKRLVSYLRDTHQVEPFEYHEEQTERVNRQIVRSSAGIIELIPAMGDLPRLFIYPMRGKSVCSAQVGPRGQPTKWLLAPFSFDIKGHAEVLDEESFELALRKALNFVAQELGTKYGDEQPLASILSDVYLRRTHPDLFNDDTKPAVEPASGTETTAPRRRPG
jgi:hypothetical protein